MKVCLVYKDALENGGYPRDVRWLSSALKQRGIEVVIVSNTCNSKNMEGIVEDIGVVDIKEFSNVVKDADIVHFFGVFVLQHIPLIRKAQRLGIKTVLSPLGQLMPMAIARRRIKKAVFMKVFKQVFSKISALHVFSEVEASSLSLWNMWDNKPKIVASLGVYPENEPERCFCTSKPDGFIRILFFGRNDIYQKGIDILLEAFKKFVDKLSESDIKRVELLIAGQPYKESVSFIESYVKQKNLSNVRILGPVSEDQKRDLFKNAAFLVFLSRVDGPPRPIRESIAIGTPVIVSAETNMGNLVKEYNAGFQVPLNSNAVADTFQSILSHHELRESFIEGVMRLRERLQWEQVAYDYINGYKSILNNS